MWAKVQNGAVVAYPYGPSDLRKDNPNTSFPASMPEESWSAWDLVPVEVQGQPSHDPITQNCVRVNPTLSSGVWVETWAVSPASAQEIERRRADQLASIQYQRSQAYKEESDPIFFKVQRSEATMAEWSAKVDEIRAQFPYPEV